MKLELNDKITCNFSFTLTKDEFIKNDKRALRLTVLFSQR